MRADHVLGQGSLIGRRTVLGLAAVVAAIPVSTRSDRARAEEARPVPTGVKAMLFDVQGTVFDYYGPFMRIDGAVAARKGLSVDWSGFLSAWTSGATSIILAVVAGKRPWIPPGRIFREALDDRLAANGWAGRLDEADRLALMSVWGQMTPWPDCVAGLERLRRKFTVAALTNVGMATVIANAKRERVSFDTLFTGELTHAYKPATEAYQSAAAALGLSPDETMMVAAHKFDLRAAKAAGLRTAYIPRPFELGPETKVDRSPESFIDIVAADLVDLSTRVGAA